MMKRRTTEELISELAEAPAPAAFSPAVTVMGVAGAVALGMAAVWITAGWRTDLAVSLTSPITLAKLLLPLMLGIMAMYHAVALTRPEARTRVWPVLVPASAALALLLATAAITPAGQIIPGIAGQTAFACISSVLALSIVPLLAGIALLRRGASTNPQLSGLLIGLASGSGAAAGYALHCTEDSPLFFVTWFGLCIMAAGGLGAYLGRTFLRW